MFGERIKKERLNKGITQEELGEILNKTKNNISQYETEKRQPDTDTLIKLADYFDVSADYLLGRTNIRDAIIVSDKIDGKDVELVVNKNIYPDGLTHEQVIEILEKFKAMGFEYKPKEK